MWSGLGPILFRSGPWITDLDANWFLATGTLSGELSGYNNVNTSCTEREYWSWNTKVTK